MKFFSITMWKKLRFCENWKRFIFFLRQPWFRLLLSWEASAISVLGWAAGGRGGEEGAGVAVIADTVSGQNQEDRMVALVKGIKKGVLGSLMRGYVSKPDAQSS
jgi:hypothetical protein